METSTIVLIDDNNVEQEYKIFFTYENPENGKTYVFYYDDETLDEDRNPIYYVSRYDEENNIYELDLEEQEIAQEVFNTFVEENEYEITE